MSKKILLLGALTLSTPCFGNWTMNIGYHNPPNSLIGANFLYDFNPLAIEIGIGSLAGGVDIDDNDNNDKNDNDNVNLSLGGDVNLKYFFGGSGVRPFIEGGIMLGTGSRVGDNSGFGLSTGNAFLGGGLFFGSPKLYGYAGVTFTNDFDLQLGIGFDI